MTRRKNAKDLESILKRAENLFRKGNYDLAKREYEKAKRMLEQKNDHGYGEEIVQKLEICRKKAKRFKAEDLIKRGKKYAKRGNIKEAINCFEDAYEINGEEWIQEKINRLKTLSLRRDVTKTAREAEAAGQYLTAADLYDQAFTIQQRDEFLIKKALCLIKAERYEEGVSLFKDLDLPDPETLYNYGFALAKVGRYFECLKVWDRIGSRAEDFLKQKDAVRSLMAADLYERFDQAEDFGRNYEGVRYLQSFGDLKGLESILEYCKYALIEDLWQEDEYAAITELLGDYPNRMGSAMLALRAKLSYKMARRSEKYLAELTMYWLSALYNPTFMKSDTEGAERDAVRKKLISMAEDVIKERANAGHKGAEGQLKYWNVEKKVVEDLRRLVGDREELGHLVLAPRFAALVGRSDQILQLIRENRSFFQDREHYLMMGSHYSPAGDSLYYIEVGDYENAISNLPEEDRNDELTTYGVKRVKLACGLHCLEHEESKPERYFREAADLFHISDRYKREIIEKAMDAHELDELHRYEVILREISKNNPPNEIIEALSLVVSRRAFHLYNQNMINLKNLEATLEKALELNPENEHARGLLSETKVDWELIGLGKALNRHKMNRACKIAVESQNQEVRYQFFEFFENAIKQIDQVGLEEKEKISLLHDFYGWCARVDDSHLILYEIEDLIEELEQG